MTILFEGKSEKMKMYSECARGEVTKGKSKRTHYKFEIYIDYILKARTQYLYYPHECITNHTRTHTRFPAV